MEKYKSLELFAWCGGLALGPEMANQYGQLGNAVPVNLAYAVGLSLYKLLESIGGQ